MGDWDDEVQADARALAEEFGEPAEYRKASDAENPIDTPMVIDRDPLEAQREDNRRSVAAPIEIEVLVEDVDAVVPGSDQVKIAPLKGGTPRWYPVAALTAHDAGFWRIAVNR